MTADGDVVVPIDAEAFGFWLKAAFGEPTTSGTGPWTHEFRSGELDAAVAVDRDGDARGAALRDVLGLRPRPAQLADAALGAADRHRQAGGAGRDRRRRPPPPARRREPALKRFGHFNGSITRNGTALGNVVSAEITYANNLDRIETIRSDGRIDGADPSIAALTGRVEVRFADQVLVNQAIAGDPCELEFGYALPSGESFTFTVHAVYLPRPRIEIAGPQGVQATFDWQAARDADAGPDVHRHARQRHRGVLGGTHAAELRQCSSACRLPPPLQQASSRDFVVRTCHHPLPEPCMIVSIRASLDYAVEGTAPVLMQIEAADLPDQHVVKSRLDLADAIDFVRVAADEGVGERSLFRVEGRLLCSMQPRSRSTASSRTFARSSRCRYRRCPARR